MTYSPLFSYILVKPEQFEDKNEVQTQSGLILPGSAEKRPDLIVAKGEVLEVGPDCKHVKKKDTILYNYFSGNTLVEVGDDPMGKDNVEYHLVFEGDVLAKVK